MTYSTRNWSFVTAIWLTGMAVWLSTLLGMGISG